MGRRSKRGFTLIEVITVIAVIAMIIAILLPAVQSSREAARRSQCLSNIRQIAIGVQTFEATRGHYPITGFGFTKDNKPWGLSVVGQILGELEASPLASEVQSAGQSLQDVSWDRLPVDAPRLLHCPSDSLAEGRANSYRFTRGILPTWPEDSGGVFVYLFPYKPSDVSDGLSNTAFVSERLIGSGDYRRNRTPWVLSPMAANAVTQNCIQSNINSGSSPASPPPEPAVGTRWLSGLLDHQVYYHAFPPNALWHDCGTLTPLRMGLISARSDHPSGVHVGFGDGRVVFVPNVIDLKVWRLWSTREGGES